VTIFFISQILFKIRISYKILRGQINTYEKVFTKVEVMKVEESVYKLIEYPIWSLFILAILKVPFLCTNIELDLDDNDNDNE